MPVVQTFAPSSTGPLQAGRQIGGQDGFLWRWASKCPPKVGQPSLCGLGGTSKDFLGRAQEPQAPMCPLSAYASAPWGLSILIK